MAQGKVEVEEGIVSKRRADIYSRCQKLERESSYNPKEREKEPSKWKVKQDGSDFVKGLLKTKLEAQKKQRALQEMCAALQDSCDSRSPEIPQRDACQNCSSGGVEGAQETSLKASCTSYTSASRASSSMFVARALPKKSFLGALYLFWQA